MKQTMKIQKLVRKGRPSRPALRARHAVAGVGIHSESTRPRHPTARTHSPPRHRNSGMSTFGTLFRVTTFGESHCRGVGAIVDGSWGARRAARAHPARCSLYIASGSTPARAAPRPRRRAAVPATDRGGHPAPALAAAPGAVDADDPALRERPRLDPVGHRARRHARHARRLIRPQRGRAAQRLP